MITFETFHSRIEAELIKKYLATENIVAVVREPVKAPALAEAGGVDLLVQPADLDRAKELLNSIPFPK